MASMHTPDATLRSVAACLAAEQAERALSLTILFHPRVDRIGESWEAPLDASSLSLELSRHQPAFARQEGLRAASALLEPHISRQALRLSWRGETLTVARVPGACRCRLQGRDIGPATVIDAAQLARGVTLQLGHAVVLWLRIGPARPVSAAGKQHGPELLGSSVAMQRLRQQVARAGAADLDVLVLGETGVGKELTAGGIHRASRRAGAPLVSINMAAIPVSLAPALLFGSARGAYTGAARASAGYFQQAEGGSLFLDEIGDTPAEIQPQLLRALQQRQVQVVGGALETVDLRIIAATDASVAGEGCHFSAALRHRLGSIEIQVPPLREHAEDTGELLWHFLRAAAGELACEALLPGEHSDDVQIARWAELFQLCAAHAWPGNVRELANVARQVLVASDGQLMVPATLLARLQALPAAREMAAPTAPPSRPMRAVDGAEFLAVYRSNACEVAATAQALGVSRQAIYRRIAETPGLRLAAEVPEAELATVLADCGGDVVRAAQTLQVSVTSLRARLRQCREVCR
jgi:DNA-binding NtrC family response regulator